MKIKKKKGFTLIELLIVVAIIAILAAIAIPQFSSYRIKGYNSSATADLRNGRTAEEAFFSDWQVYASTGAAAVQGDGAAVGSSYFPVAIKAKGINATSAPSADTTFSTGLSQNVSIILSTNPTGAVNFVGITKNTSGDRCFAMDSDVTAVYWINGPTGTALDTSDKLSASDTNLTNDVDGKAGSKGCKAATGQLTYVSL